MKYRFNDDAFLEADTDKPRRSAAAFMALLGPALAAEGFEPAGEDSFSRSLCDGAVTATLVVDPAGRSLTLQYSEEGDVVPLRHPRELGRRAAGRRFAAVIAAVGEVYDFEPRRSYLGSTMSPPGRWI